MRFLDNRPLKVLGSLAAVAVMVITACGPGASPTATAPTATTKPAVSPTAVANATATAKPTAAAETVKKGGVLQTAHLNYAPSFMALESSTQDTLFYTAPVYSQIIQLDPLNPDSQKIIGDLAETWNLSTDGKTYTFNLRKGVKWQDGEALTCDDAAYTLTKIKTPEGMTGSPRASGFKNATSIACTDPQTLVITLAKPAPSFLVQLLSGFTVIYPKHIWEPQGTKALRDKLSAGTGPFMLATAAPGEYIEYKKNPNYYDPTLPYLDGVRVTIMKDEAARTAALRTGQLDTLYSVGIPAGKTMEAQASNLVITKGVDAGSMPTLQVNKKRQPWNDPKFGQALSLAIDRPAWIKAIAAGEGYAGGGVLLKTGPWGLSDDQLKAIPGYDISNIPANQEKAKQILKDLGYTDRIKVTIVVRTSHVPYALPVVADLAKVGIDATLNPLEDVPYYDKAGRQDFDLIYQSHALNWDDPDSAFYEHWYCGSPRNYPGLCDKTIDDLLDQQSSTVDPVARKKLVDQVHVLILEANSKIVIGKSGKWIPKQPYVRNYAFSSILYSSTNKFERVWLAK